MELQEEFLSMTIKGITRTCFGSVFSDDEEIRKMAQLYHQVLINVYTVLNIYVIGSLCFIASYVHIFDQNFLYMWYNSLHQNYT